MKKIKYFLVVLSCLFLSEKLQAHAVQIVYCTLASGEIRVYLEHWHGDQTNASIQQSVLNMNVTVGGVTNAVSAVGNGFVNNTPIAGLTGCLGAVQVVYACAANEINCCNGRPANSYNDWIYFDFPPPGCEEPVTIEIISATDPTFTLVEGCNNLFPSTITETFQDLLPPTVICPEDLAIQCDEDIPNAFINFTQFLDSGGSADDACGVVNFQLINETTE